MTRKMFTNHFVNNDNCQGIYTPDPSIICPHFLHSSTVGHEKVISVCLCVYLRVRVRVCVCLCDCGTNGHSICHRKTHTHTHIHIQRTLIAKASSHNSHMLFSTTLTQIANNKNSKYRTVQKAARVAVVLLPSCCYSVCMYVCVFGCV